MTDLTQTHSPTPAFRAALEDRMLDAFRRQARFTAPRRGFRASHWRAAAILAIGIVLGAGSGFASAQVRDAQQRSELESVIASKRDLAMLRLELARKHHEIARQRFGSGVITREELLAAEAELRKMEVVVARLALDLAEVRASAAAPRDELWTPLVGTRDFVKERLNLDASTAQQRLSAREAGIEEARRRVKAGVITEGELHAAEAEFFTVQRELELIAQKLSLRNQALEQRLSPDEVSRRLQIMELKADIARAERHLSLAGERRELLAKQASRGVAGELEVKRAEVDMLERRIQLQALVMQLSLLEGARRQ